MVYNVSTNLILWRQIMLTNNKKSYFIKSIAMIMAVLMVLAVALTGCGNKAAEEAAKKADDAQTTATEAKTAAEAVAAALKDYLKVSDAVTAAAIDAMIAEAIGDCLTIEDLAGYVKSEDLKKVDDKLANYVLASALAGEITKALEGYATSAGMGDAIAAAKTELEGKIATAIQAADKTATINELNNKIANIAGDYLKGADKTALQNAINEVKTTVAGHTTTLANLQKSIDDLSAALGKETTDAAAKYATKEAVKALQDADKAMAADIKQLQETVLAILKAFGVQTEEAADKTLAEMLAEFSPTEITALIAEKMSLTDWNNATDIVIKTIADVQEMMEKIYGEDGVAGTSDDGIYTHADKMTITNAIKAIDSDIVVFNENGELTEYATVAKLLEYRILRVPTVKAMEELKEHLDQALEVKTFEEKLADLTAALKALGHTHTVGTGANAKTYQVTTVDDLAGFYKFNDDLDALIVSYRYDVHKNAANKDVVENQFVGTDYAQTLGTLAVYAMYKATYKDTTKTPYYCYSNVDAAKPAEKDWTFTHQFYTVNDLRKNNAATPNFSLEGKWNSTTSAYDAIDLYTMMAMDGIFAWTQATTQNVTFGNTVHGGEEITVTEKVKDEATLADTYNAIRAQLTVALTAIKDANVAMYNFINTQLVNGKIKLDGKEMTLAKAVADGLVKSAEKANYYVEALEVEMCEPMDDAAYNSGKLFLMNGKDGHDVETAMEYAFNINTCDGNSHSDELKDRIDEYELYFDLMYEAWNLLFDRYCDYAKKLQEKIIADYKSVLYAVEAADDTVYTDLFGQTALIDSAYISGKWADMAAKGLVSSDDAGVAIFIKAFLDGAENFEWKSAGTAVANTGISIKKNFDNALVKFYDNNGEAATGTKAADVAEIYSNPLKTIAANVPDLELLLTVNTIEVVNTLRGLKGENIPEAERTDIKTFFDKYLNETIKNLDETYARFLIEDYKKDVINDLYVQAAEYTEFYSVDERAAALQEALEHYITGWSVSASTAGKAGEANKLFKKETLMLNATVTTELAKPEYAVTADQKEPTAGSTKVEYVAIEAIKAVNKVAYTSTVDVEVTINNAPVTMKVSNSFDGVMENAAIKNNFEDYLATAVNNVEYVAAQYAAATNITPELRALVEIARQDARYNISVIQWQTAYNADAWAMLTYKTYYTQLLLQISSEDNTVHFEYLTGNKAADELAKIKSNSFTPATGHDWVVGHEVVKPNKIVSAWAQYHCYGAAALLMDKAANNNTKYTATENNKTVEKYLYE